MKGIAVVTEHTDESGLLGPESHKGDGAGEPAWYAIHTYSGYENKVKTNLVAQYFVGFSLSHGDSERSVTYLSTQLGPALSQGPVRPYTHEDTALRPTLWKKVHVDPLSANWMKSLSSLSCDASLLRATCTCMPWPGDARNVREEASGSVATSAAELSSNARITYRR